MRSVPTGRLGPIGNADKHFSVGHRFMEKPFQFFHHERVRLRWTNAEAWL